MIKALAWFLSIIGGTGLLSIGLAFGSVGLGYTTKAALANKAIAFMQQRYIKESERQDKAIEAATIEYMRFEAATNEYTSQFIRDLEKIDVDCSDEFDPVADWLFCKNDYPEAVQAKCGTPPAGAVARLQGNDPKAAPQ